MLTNDRTFFKMVVSEGSKFSSEVEHCFLFLNYLIREQHRVSGEILSHRNDMLALGDYDIYFNVNN